MRVRMTLDVDERDRYVVARYFGKGAVRATRAQVRAFAAGAFRYAVREHADAFHGRQRATVRRLAAGSPERGNAEIRPPAEKQLNLLAGAW